MSIKVNDRVIYVGDEFWGLKGTVTELDTAFSKRTYCYVSFDHPRAIEGELLRGLWIVESELKVIPSMTSES